MNRPKVDFFNQCVLSIIVIFTCGNCDVKSAKDKKTSKSSINEIPFEHVIIDENGPGDIWGKAVGDINGDEKIDLLAGGWKDGGLVWYENPSWEKHIISPEGGFSTDHEIYDMDGDGDNDVVSLIHPGQAGSATLVWYENPYWARHVIEESQAFHDIEVADFNGDGLLDVVARNQGSFDGSGDTLFFYLQQKDNSWAKYKVPCPNGEGLRVGDINLDGLPDVVVNQAWFENTGDGIHWEKHIYAPRYYHLDTFIDIGDINGDGLPDIVLSPAELAGEYYRISWFEAPEDPTGKWKEHVVEPYTEAVHHFVGLADMNNNGETDIITAQMMQSKNPPEVSIYHNLGKGEAWEKQVISTEGSHSIRLVDIDGDGDMDLYGANWRGDDRVHLWINQTIKP